MPEIAGQRRLLPFGAEHAQKAELAFEHSARPGEAGGGEAGGEHAGFRRAAEMQPLDHAAVAAGKFEEAAGQRAGDADGIGHRPLVEAEQMAAGDRRAKRPGGARRMEAARLVGMAGSAADADHHLVAGDKSGDQVAAGCGRTRLLRHRKRRRQYRRAGMRAGTGPGQAVQFEGVRQRAVGERCRRRLHRAAAPEDAAGAAGAGALGIVDDDPAPGQRAAADAGGDRVDDRVLGAGRYRFRQILIAQRRGIAGQLHRLFGHSCLRQHLRLEWVSEA